MCRRPTDYSHILSWVVCHGEERKRKSQEKETIKENPDKKDGTRDRVKSWILQPVDFVMQRHRGNRGLERKEGPRVKVRVEWFWKKK